MAKYRMFAELILELPEGLTPTMENFQLAARKFKSQIMRAKLPTIARVNNQVGIDDGSAVWSLTPDITDRAVWLVQTPNLEEISNASK